MIALPDGVLALGGGTVLALGAAVLVLSPLLRDEPELPAPRPRRAAPRTARSESESAVEALREIEFDRATGKLSDDDYQSLKATYTRDALAELRARDVANASRQQAAVAVSDSVVEQTIRRYRSVSATCPVDGTRPEADAEFCSACGRYLPARCPSCGGECTEREQRFCSHCGDALAA